MKLIENLINNFFNIDIKRIDFNNSRGVFFSIKFEKLRLHSYFNKSIKSFFFSKFKKFINNDFS